MPKPDKEFSAWNMMLTVKQSNGTSPTDAVALMRPPGRQFCREAGGLFCWRTNEQQSEGKA